MTRFHFFVIFLITIVSGKKLKGVCPPQEDLPSCSCEWKGRLWISCNDIMNVWDLKSIITYLSEYNVGSFRLSNSFLLNFPKGLFANFPIKELEMFNCEVLGVESEDGSEMFTGIENTLQTLYFYNVTGMDTWKWSAFTALNRLTSFFIRRGDLTVIEKDFASISPEHVKLIHLDGNKIKHIDTKAFQNHVQLEYWELAENLITEIHRDMLPKPATRLQSISLRENKIEVIPNDFFTEMPALKYVWLGWNKIKFLPSEIFLPLQNGQRFVFDVRFNEIYCCSDLKFLIKADYREVLIGACKFPEVLRDKEINKLKEGDLEHGLC